MGELRLWLSKGTVLNTVPTVLETNNSSSSFLHVYGATTAASSPKLITASLKRYDNNSSSQTNKKAIRTARRLITISTAEGRWHGKWNSDYIFSLRDLQLQDLAEAGDREAPVFISLSVYKHAGFGLSVDGKITTSFIRKCSICTTPFCREIDVNFTVWVLSSSRGSVDSNELPELGGDDPSVIYVKPGCEADLDSLIQDTIRLNYSVKETCSDPCEKSVPRLHYVGKQNSSSIDKRWSKLLELKKALP